MSVLLDFYLINIILSIILINMQIIREKYIKKALEKGKTSTIVLLDGLRGAGKSQLLGEIGNRLKQQRPPVRVLSLNALTGIKNDRHLLEQARGLGAGISALLIDNAEYIEDLYTALHAILKTYNTRIFLTGQRTSGLEKMIRNSSLPQSIIPVLPFSYKEFLLHQELRENHAAFLSYLSIGGLPQSLLLPVNTKESKELRKLIADSFILENIIEPYAIRNPILIRRILEKIAKTSGDQVSFRSIKESLETREQSISNQSLIDYLNFCSEAKLLYKIPIVDIKTKKIIEAGYAWYFSDLGMRNTFSAGNYYRLPFHLQKTENEKALENAVFLSLIDKGYTISKGRITKGSSFIEYITFIAEREGKKIYIQLSPLSQNLQSQIQKKEALLSIKDAWPKYLVGSEEEDGLTKEGIQVISERSLLLEGGI